MANKRNSENPPDEPVPNIKVPVLTPFQRITKYAKSELNSWVLASRLLSSNA